MFDYVQVSHRVNECGAMYTVTRATALSGVLSSKELLVLTHSTN